MTLQSSGQISIYDIKAEFNGTSNKLRDYYRGGAFVPDIPQNANIPTSGAISLFDFYGATNTPPLSYLLTGDPSPTGTAPGNPTYPVSISTSTLKMTASGGIAPYTFSVQRIAGNNNDFFSIVVASASNYTSWKWTKTYCSDNTSYNERWRLTVVDFSAQESHLDTTVYISAT